MRGPKFYCIDRNDFEFIDVSGEKATVPIFKEGQELTGKLIKELAGRGPVYIRLTKPLSKANEDQRIVLSSSSSDSDFELPPVFSFLVLMILNNYKVHLCNSNSYVFVV